MTDVVCIAACLSFAIARALCCWRTRCHDIRSGQRPTTRRLSFYCTLLLRFPWPASKSPSSGLRGKQNRSCFLLLVFTLLWSFHGISKIGGWGGAVWERLLENPALPLSRRTLLAVFEGLVSCFPADGFTLHLHAEITHSICENHLLEQTHLLVLMQFKPCNYSLATHASSVYQTRVGPLEILTHRIHVMLSQSPSLTRLRIWCSSGFHASCPDASFDIQSWNSRMVPTIMWGRFTG